MGRIIAVTLVVAACCGMTGTAFAHKGFYVGGGFDSTAPSGDLDGKSQVTNTAGDRLGSIGKLDTGTGINLDAGWNFTNNLGFEYFSSTSAHTAKHQAESKSSNAAAVNTMLGLRLAGHLSESIEGFVRAGYAASAVSYEKYGHLGTTTAGVFTSVANKSFVVSGSGAAYGAGLEFYGGNHIGVALGYTVFAVKLVDGSIDSEGKKRLPKDLSETMGATDVTVAWHF
jgi:outer membrane protein W